LSWSVDGTIAVALGEEVYLWSEEDGSVRSVSINSVQDITSVAFNSTGDILAIAREDGSVLLQSPSEKIPRAHISPVSNDAVGALSWRPPPKSTDTVPEDSARPKINEILVIGCFDGQVVLVDIIWYLEEFYAKVSRRGGWNDVHSDQICGIAWSNDGLSFATGANDNRVCLFQIPMGMLGMHNHWEKKWQWTHQAAVKALAFKSGKGGILAAGSQSLPTPKHHLNYPIFTLRIHSLRVDVYALGRFRRRCPR
jgi:WD40 repeat protein